MCNISNFKMTVSKMLTPKLLMIYFVEQRKYSFKCNNFDYFSYFLLCMYSTVFIVPSIASSIIGNCHDFHNTKITFASEVFE